MALKRTCNIVQETMVEEPTHELNVPSKAIREKEKEDYEEQKRP
jgi:hypothetical protein